MSTFFCPDCNRPFAWQSEAFVGPYCACVPPQITIASDTAHGWRTPSGQPDSLPNGGVDFFGRCLRCGRDVKTSGGCNCNRVDYSLTFEPARHFRPDALKLFNDVAQATEGDSFTR